MSGKHYRCPHLAEHGIDPILDDATLGVDICKNCPEEHGCVLDRNSTRRSDQQRAQTLKRASAVVLMKAKGMNRKDIAVKLGVSTSSVDFYYLNRCHLPDQNHHQRHHNGK